jgi:hypothetical protein
MILIKGKTNLEEKISKNFPEWKKWALGQNVNLNTIQELHKKSLCLHSSSEAAEYTWLG